MIPISDVDAKRQGISVTALYYWQRKLTATPEMGESGQATKFVALRVADVIVARRSPNCTLILFWHRNGFCLRPKRLESERFIWPQDAEGATQMINLQHFERSMAKSTA